MLSNFPTLSSKSLKSGINFTENTNYKLPIKLSNLKTCFNFNDPHLKYLGLFQRKILKT